MKRRAIYVPPPLSEPYPYHAPLVPRRIGDLPDFRALGCPACGRVMIDGRDPSWLWCPFVGRAVVEVDLDDPAWKAALAGLGVDRFVRYASPGPADRPRAEWQKSPPGAIALASGLMHMAEAASGGKRPPAPARSAPTRCPFCAGAGTLERAIAHADGVGAELAIRIVERFLTVLKPWMGNPAVQSFAAKMQAAAPDAALEHLEHLMGAVHADQPNVQNGRPSEPSPAP